VAARRKRGVAKVRFRLELPPDFAVSDDEVRGAVSKALGGLLEGDDLCKAEGHDHAQEPKARKLPHRYMQAKIDATAKLYERQMRAMIEKIVGVLRS
jgi:hypothetical protein